jgi:hypothetical protein
MEINIERRNELRNMQEYKDTLRMLQDGGEESLALETKDIGG